MSLLSLLISHPSLAFVSVTATVDKNPVIVNESFVLTIIANDDVNSNAFDSSSLLKDFVVGRTSVSSQTSMVNFKTTRTTKWTTVLIARKAGNYIIPALSIDSALTQPIQLKVLTASDPQAEKQQDIFITTDISSKEVYVQQQLSLTVKLHFAAELKRGSLTEPSFEGANITQVGEDKEADTVINGRRFRVIERTYAISPQRSGDFVLKSPVFSGQIMQPSSRRNGFLSFAETKPVSVIGEDISLKVNPIPADYQGAWLPSELLTLHQQWQPTPENFVVGEPITRVVTLTAAGLSEEQLPALNMQMPKGLKVYPDQAELHTGMNNSRLVSQKVRNFAIVANKVGTYTLPEITIPWWNTVTNKFEQATIPAQTINVQINPALDNEAPMTLATEEAFQNNKISSSNTVVEYKASWLQWLFLALWLLTTLAWIISYQKQKSSKPPNKKLSPVNDHYLALMSACKKNNAERALGLIAPWYNTIANQPIATLAQVLQLNPKNDLSDAINELQKCSYGQKTQSWQGKKLLQAISASNKDKMDNTTERFSLNP